ncbi:hypothetical protein CsSME_00013284 [Camellia sinensis var. sinensis]
MASVLEEKNRAEKEIEVLNSRLTSYSSFGEALKKEIEEVNEEQVMVELARIEAVKELGVIQAQRKEEEMKTSSMDFIKAALKRLYEETYKMKQAEKKADVNVRTLNSKLLRAKSILDAVSVAEIQAQTIASNLYFTRTIKNRSRGCQKGEETKM